MQHAQRKLDVQGQRLRESVPSGFRALPRGLANTIPSVDSGVMSADKVLGHPADVTVGSHRALFDGTCVRIAVQGVVSEADAIQLMAFILHWDHAVGNIALMVHTPAAFSVTPEARKYFVRSARTGRPPIPMVVIGTSAMVRGILMLLINAIRITLQTDVPVRFCESEAESLDWLKEKHRQREAFLATGTMPPSRR